MSDGPVTLPWSISPAELLSFILKELQRAVEVTRHVLLAHLDCSFSSVFSVSSKCVLSPCDFLTCSHFLSHAPTFQIPDIQSLLVCLSHYHIVLLSFSLRLSYLTHNRTMLPNFTVHIVYALFFGLLIPKTLKS